MYKRVIIIVLLFMILSLAGCTKEEGYIKVIVPNGTPLIAISGVESDNMIIENVSGPSLLTAAMTAKTHDIIIAPITTGVKLYNREASDYKLDSIITFSNLYLVSKNELTDINDLENQKIIGYGQGTTPSIILEKALQDVNAEITYVSSVSDAVSFLVNETDEYDYILTAEPTLSVLIHQKNLKLNILDLGEVVENDLPIIPQAGIFVNPDSKYLDEIKEYINEIKNNIASLNNDPKGYAAKIVDKNDWLRQMSADIIEQSIPKSNIDYIKAKDNQEQLHIFYQYLNSINYDILNGDVDENFYY